MAISPRPVRKYVWYGLAALVVALPFVSAWLLARVYLGENLADYTPFWSDEILNWSQVAAFARAGFQGGYFTVNEQAAAFSWARFYAHGPAYPMFYGAIAALAGWEYASPPLFNMLALSLTLGVFILAVKPDLRQLALFGLITASFWSWQFYLVTSMREVLDHAFAILLAAFFIKTIFQPTHRSLAWYLLFMAYLVWLAWFKVNWSFLFLPYFLIARQRFGLKAWHAVLIALLLIGLSFYVYSQAAAPYPNFSQDFFEALKISPNRGLRALTGHIEDNLRNLVNPRHSPLWLVMRAQLLAGIFFGVWLVWKAGGDRQAAQTGLLIVLSGAMLFSATIVIYDVYSWRDYRVFSSLVLFFSLALLACRRFTFPVLLIVSNLALLPVFLSLYAEIMPASFSVDRAGLQELSQELSNAIPYEPGQDGWANTLLVPSTIARNPLILAVPAGIGLSWFSAPQQLKRIKSRHLLIDPDSYAVLSQRACLQFRATTALGDLYTNLGGECAP
jgi:hypothetical protein